MKNILIISVVFTIFVTFARGENGLLADFNADQLPTIELPENVEITVDKNIKTEGTGSLKIEYKGSDPISITLFEVDHPEINKKSIIYTADIKSENVQNKAYIEMFCVFDYGNNDVSFFSRNLNHAVSGSTDWNQKGTQFFFKENEYPSKVKLGVRFEGPGTIWIDKIVLKNVATRIGYYIDFGTIFGVSIGFIGGLIGILCSIGKARRFVIGLSYATVLVCTIIFISGIILLSTGANYVQWQPFILCGGIGLLVIGLNIPTIKRRFIEIETRKLKAKDM